MSRALANRNRRAFQSRHDARGPVVERQHEIACDVKERLIQRVRPHVRQSSQRTMGRSQAGRPQPTFAQSLTVTFEIAGRLANAIEAFVALWSYETEYVDKLFDRCTKDRVGRERGNALERMPRKVTSCRQSVGGQDLPEEELKRIGGWVR